MQQRPEERRRRKTTTRLLLFRFMATGQADCPARFLCWRCRAVGWKQGVPALRRFYCIAIRLACIKSARTQIEAPVPRRGIVVSTYNQRSLAFLIMVQSEFKTFSRYIRFPRHRKYGDQKRLDLCQVRRTQAEVVVVLFRTGNILISGRWEG